MVNVAAEAGVTHFALTDHDTVDGLCDARCQAQNLGLHFITGVEFSSQWNKRGIHIVGLGFDENHPVMRLAVKQMGTIRAERGVLIAEKLDSIGITGSLDGARRHANGGQVGRPHFAEYLIEIGKAKNLNQAFKRYLGAGKPGDVKHQWPVMETINEWILSAGGAPVLAHPLKYDLTRTKLKRLLEDFKEGGGLAVEVISGNDQTPQQTRDLIAMANDFGLLASVGSDFHSPNMPWQAMGKMGTLPPAANAIWQLWSQNESGM